MFSWVKVRTFLVSTTAIVCVSAAHADELPITKKILRATVVPKSQDVSTTKKRPFQWQGFYIGIGGGASRVQSKSHVHSSATQNQAIGGGYFENYSVAPSIDQTKSSLGAFATLSLGANRQFDNLVVGGFLDVSVERVKTSTSQSDTTSSYVTDGALPGGVSTGTNYTAEAVLNHSVTFNGDATVGARIGYLADEKTLVYVLGGYTLANIEAVSSLTVTHEPGSALSGFSISTKSSGWRGGYTIGGGIEFALTENWSLQTEYRLTHFGSVKSTTNTELSDGTASISQNVDVTNQTVRAVLNYHF